MFKPKEWQNNEILQQILLPFFFFFYIFLLMFFFYFSISNLSNPIFILTLQDGADCPVNALLTQSGWQSNTHGEKAGYYISHVKLENLQSSSFKSSLTKDIGRQVRILQVNIEDTRRDKSEYLSTIAWENEIDIIALQEIFVCYLRKCSLDVSRDK